jgi:hypothetical protein
MLNTSIQLSKTLIRFSYMTQTLNKAIMNSFLSINWVIRQVLSHLISTMKQCLYQRKLWTYKDNHMTYLECVETLVALWRLSMRYLILYSCHWLDNTFNWWLSKGCLKLSREISWYELNLEFSSRSDFLLTFFRTRATRDSWTKEFHYLKKLLTLSKLETRFWKSNRNLRWKLLRNQSILMTKKFLNRYQLRKICLFLQIQLIQT